LQGPHPQELVARSEPVEDVIDNEQPGQDKVCNGNTAFVNVQGGNVQSKRNKSKQSLCDGPNTTKERRI
jgi:hypothetical protein